MIISIMTFNIRYAGGDRGTKHRWSRRKEKIIKVITKYNPYFIGFQEVTYKQLRYLAEHLKRQNYEYIGVGRKDGKRKGEFNPIFFKKNFKKEDEIYSIRKISSGTFWLSDYPHKPSNTWNPGYSNRICTWANFEITKENSANDTNKTSIYRIAFYNTHLDVRKKEARMKSIKLINEMIGKNSEGYLAILTGDMNFPRKSEEYIEFSGMFRDLLKEFNEDKVLYLSEVITFHGFTGATNWKDALRSGHKEAKGSENLFDIDYVAVKPDVKINIKECKVVHDNPLPNPETYPSDHWPIYAEIDLE